MRSCAPNSPAHDPPFYLSFLSLFFLICGTGRSGGGGAATATLPGYALGEKVTIILADNHVCSVLILLTVHVHTLSTMKAYVFLYDWMINFSSKFCYLPLQI